MIQPLPARLITPAALVVPLLLTAQQSSRTERLALTPPMGWNSWNHFACDVSEQLIQQTADAMVASGMRDAGYQYVVIDDCWQVARDSSGTVVADPQRFPGGMKALADYVHARGLKFGIYTTPASRPARAGPAATVTKCRTREPTPRGAWITSRSTGATPRPSTR